MKTAVALMAAAAAANLGSIANAQGPSREACDSIIAAARTGEQQAGIFLSVRTLDGTADPRSRRILINVGNAFVPPRPFKLSVFSGPSLVRALRVQRSDTAQVLRSPTVTGIYRVSMSADDSVPDIRILRQSLIEGFDNAAVAAIRAAAGVAGVFVVGTGNPIAVDVLFTSDSLPDSQRLFAASFPRLSVKDAVAHTDNASPKYPEDASPDSRPVTVSLRFVVSRDGAVDLGTVELVRSAPLPFVKAAYEALSGQKFVPATVHGCPVAQQVDYPFAFLVPEGASQGLTHR